MSLSFIKDAKGRYTVVAGGRSYCFGDDHPYFDVLVNALKDGDQSTFLNTIDLGNEIQKWSCGNFKFQDGVLYYHDEMVHQVITTRIVEMMKEGFSVKPMLNFLVRLYKNPSYSAITELYDFLRHKGLPITTDGYLMAYKAVVIYHGPDIKDKNGRTLTEGDFVDKHTKTSFRNNIGDEPYVLRRQVNDDRRIGCSKGLHVGAIDYAQEYGGGSSTIVLVKVDPADVVSVPQDENCKKMRVSRYAVIDVYEHTLEEAVFDEEDDDCDDEDWDDEDADYYDEEDEDYYDDEDDDVDV